MKYYLSEHGIAIIIAFALSIIMYGIFKYETSEQMKLQTEIILQKYRNELLEMKIKEQDLENKYLGEKAGGK